MENLTNFVISNNSSWHNISNSSQHAFDNFPSDIMPEWARNNGGVTFHVFILAYCCLGMGIVCDLYFLTSLEIISQVLALPPDIAGATFMAMGTSAPDLFTSIIGVFVSEDDIGTGTILGAAVFNLIAIPAVCGFTVKIFGQKLPKMTRFPILRDSIFYILAIITLIICIKDNLVDWVESLVMLSLFLIYLVIMYFNAIYSVKIEAITNEETNPSLEDKTYHKWNKMRLIMKTLSDYKRARIRSTKRIVLADHNERVEHETEWFERNIYFKCFLFPLTFLLKITIPKPNRCSFVLTFIISIVWLGALTYVSVWMVTIIGYTLGLPDTVAGLTILAAGASIPDLISSVLVVKKASKANMAISNSIGSNIFDILFCLALPWLLKSIINCFKKGTFNLVDTAVTIESAALPLTTSSLLVCVIALILTFYATNWNLGLSVGITFSIIYVIFVITSVTLEMKLNQDK